MVCQPASEAIASLTAYAIREGLHVENANSH